MITARRAFMQDTLGITLRPDVLPFSNMPAYWRRFSSTPAGCWRCGKATRHVGGGASCPSSNCRRRQRTSR
jgi:hypothetical protein